ncbi:MAG: YigZ family protein [Gammaproteobacteria bacterium]|nr:YigZ family protein [Gammaproteobacteria bacterium]
MIPATSLDKELEIKKSRFIARAGKLLNKESIKEVLEQMKKDYPDARHYCWAYLLGNPASAASAAMNDAGEPSGTAGKPILNVIQHKKIGDVFVVVARYFGGVKLGAGGLVRAYSGATELVLSNLELVQHVANIECEILAPFAREQLVRHLLSDSDVEITNVIYTDQVCMQVAVPETQLNQLFEKLADNQVEVSKLEE